MTTILKGLDGIKSLVGEHLGYGPYVKVTQDRINKFAEVSGDHQWIHVDLEKAKEGPYGKTIAHGMLTLAMTADLNQDIFKFEGFNRGVNYGYEKIRFPSPVPVDSEVRLGVKVLSCEEVKGGVQTIIEFTVECKGADKPACVAQMIFRHFF